MRHRIPVGDPISRSYEFAFSNLATIFGIAWLPYSVLAAIAVGVVLLLAPDFPRMAWQGHFDVDLGIHVSRILGLLGLLSFLAACMVTVGIQRQALGKHPGRVFVYFSLGAPVWRMAGAWFLAGLAIFFVGLVTAGVTAAIWFAAGKFVPSFDGVVRTLAIAAAVLWFVYMSVRLLFFLPAVVVAEERIGLGRAWELAGGNFWRIIVVVLAVFLPVEIGFAIVSSALFGPMFVMPHIHAGMDPHEIFAMVFDQMRVVGPFLLVFQIVERIVFLGLGNGLVADAYLGATAASETVTSGATPSPA